MAKRKTFILSRAQRESKDACRLPSVLCLESL
jgi:hypothetical protein